MKKLLLVLLLSLAFTGLSYADYQDGMNAYNRGDFKSAFNEWKPLALKGNAKAQTHIGSMYFNGYYVSQNYSESAYWLKKAADQSEPVAQFFLGIAYFFGLGVTESKLEAAYLIDMAIASGNKEVLKIRDNLNSQGIEF